MIVYTIGFTQKTAEQFFESLRRHDVRLLLDIRLNNVSQLAGFAKGKDLEYFLKRILDCGYVYEQNLAPTKEIMESYKGKRIGWDEYEGQYTALIRARNALRSFEARYGHYENICLLCSEADARQCHRGLLSELLKQEIPGTKVEHL